MNLLFQAAQQARLIRERQELIFWTTCGPSTTFDPKITGVAGVWFFDDGTTLAAASGAEISKTFAADGLHRAVFRPGVGGLAGITAIDFATDLVTGIGNFGKMSACLNYRFASNTGFVVDVSQICLLATSISCTPSLLSGSMSGLPRALLTYYHANNTTLIGSLVDLPATLTVAQCYNSTVIAAASIAHLTVIQDLRIYSMGWLTVDVDTVIDSMWSARAKYTYATPALQIGGTNQPPTGNVVAPEEGSDWRLDGVTWIPLTSGAKIWDLAKNVNSEARTAAWTITYTGGSIAPEPIVRVGWDVATQGEPALSAAVYTGYGYVTRQSAAITGTVTDLRVKCAATGKMKIAVYLFSTGALLGNTLEADCVAGWNTIPLVSPISVTASTAYMFLTRTSNNTVLTQLTTAVFAYCFTMSYADDFPATIPAQEYGANGVAICGVG